MDERHEDIINQLDGYGVKSVICAHTRRNTAGMPVSRRVEVLTTIYRHKTPDVVYKVYIGFAEPYYTTDLSYAILLYLEGE